MPSQKRFWLEVEVLEDRCNPSPLATLITADQSLATPAEPANQTAVDASLNITLTNLQANQPVAMPYTVTGLPFSGTTTVVPWPFISAMNLSAVRSIMGNEP